ncbi:Putative SOS response-associated peptidase YedK [Roseovarius albus]|uniref:Abasic site processing protein n=1 Tax=Roseovarius albus TaxID=1247867 RepID=A0A1X6Z8C0_9RHOB|nr:SOS response-associated peptidase family protein [Roseovarius albus]SLN43940.1 Putative SOS response-associated peptidase YedK [Roseovarius albus]
MCGKFAAGDLTQDQMLEILSGFLYTPARADPNTPEAKRGYNISPSDQAHMIRWDDDGFQLTTARWQINDPRAKSPLINSKISNTHFWRDYWDNGRCIIPALGYYEWSGLSGRKQPYFISVNRNAPLIFFAGFYRTSGDGLQCSILTRNPAPEIEHIHSRMPVILSPAEINDWLTYTTPSNEAQDTLGTDWEGRFEVTPVAPITKSSEGPEMTEPWAPQQTSFDF